MAVDICQALSYNKKSGPKPFLCQITRQMIDPTTESGVSWVVKMQECIDDPWESKPGGTGKRLAIDGKMGPSTTREIVGRYGPLSESPLYMHPMPLLVAYWGYDHAHDWDSIEWPCKDAAWERYTSSGTWHTGMMRLVSGWDPKTRTFNRTPRDWISLDELSIGIAHFWADTAPRFLASFVSALPELSALAWGEETAKKMKNPDWTRSQIRVLQGKRSHQAKYNWLLVGWWFAAPHADAMGFQATTWLEKYTKSALSTISKMGWSKHLRGRDGGRILAAVVRMTNSGGALEMLRNSARRLGDKDPMAVIKDAYYLPKKSGGYEKPDRWDTICRWNEFDGPAPQNTKM